MIIAAGTNGDHGSLPEPIPDAREYGLWSVGPRMLAQPRPIAVPAPVRRPEGGRSFSQGRLDK